MCIKRLRRCIPVELFRITNSLSSSFSWLFSLVYVFISLIFSSFFYSSLCTSACVLAWVGIVPAKNGAVVVVIFISPSISIVLKSPRDCNNALRYNVNWTFSNVFYAISSLQWSRENPKWKTKRRWEKTLISFESLYNEFEISTLPIYVSLVILPGRGFYSRASCCYFFLKQNHVVFDANGITNSKVFALYVR